MADTKKNSYISAVGRRKESIARVRLSSGSGQIIVNEKPIAEYFPGPIYQKAYQRPFEATQTLGKFLVSIKVAGGGISSQLGAVVHGISRALASVDDKKYRKDLKKEGLLTRDARVKERRKYGLAHKARAKKQSPKR